jgi:diguanylate cyclase (GGDEF)-like protein
MSWFKKKSPPAPIQEPVEIKIDSAIDKNKLERDSCNEHLKEAMESGNQGVVLKLYIENFKRLNQIFGYEYCEAILKQILDFLRELTRKDVYHYIGVEFIIILDGYTQGQALYLAEDLAERFDRAWKVNGTDCFCSTQMGICSYPGHASTPDQMLKCLDLAVSKAGEGGPNQAVVFDTALYNQLLRRQTIAHYLKTALDKDEVEIRYRPTLKTDKNVFLRAELYMRIFIKGLGLIGAGEFLPVAEDSGQIKSIQYYGLKQVCQCISELLLKGCEFESVALPISPVLLLQEDFPQEVERSLKEYGIPEGKLALEIQESALTMGYLNANITLQKLKGMGVELILNEFGSGYSGISTILDLPVDTLKLERLFVWQLETNKKSRYIMEGLIRMAKDLNITIIAEGVETENQVTILTEAGCDFQQGFFYSPTLEKDALLQILGTTLDDSIPVLEEAKQKMSRS